MTRVVEPLVLLLLATVPWCLFMGVGFLLRDRLTKRIVVFHLPRRTAQAIALASLPPFLAGWAFMKFVLRLRDGTPESSRATTVLIGVMLWSAVGVLQLTGPQVVDRLWPRSDDGD